MTKTLRNIIGWALALTVLQIVWVCALAPGDSGAGRYVSLCNWDSGWYAGILERGYVSTIPPVAQRGELANVGFFPGYPLGARWLGWILRTDSYHSLLVLSQLSAWAFWVYVLLFLRTAGASLFVTVCSVAAILCHPGAFYLVVGYSESLFTAALLGFLYWASRRAWVASVIHGFVMTSTRLVGLPVAFAPAFEAFFRSGGRLRDRVRAALPGTAAGAVAALGGLSFFAFCRLKFGHWDLYMQTLRIGWYVWSEPTAIYNWEVYRITGELWQRAVSGDVFAMSEISVPLTLAQFAAMAVIEGLHGLRAKGRSRWRERLALYASAWLMFHVAVCGRFCLRMMGMARYTMPVYILLVLAAAHLAADQSGDGPRSGDRRVWKKAAFALVLAAACVAMVLAQKILAFNHTHGRWAA